MQPLYFFPNSLHRETTIPPGCPISHKSFPPNYSHNLLPFYAYVYFAVVFSQKVLSIYYTLISNLLSVVVLNKVPNYCFLTQDRKLCVLTVLLIINILSIHIFTRKEANQALANYIRQLLTLIQTDDDVFSFETPFKPADIEILMKDITKFINENAENISYVDYV